MWREKYSEMKLEANFLKVSPAYLTATPGNAMNVSFGDSQMTITQLSGNGTKTNFYVVRHADFTSTSSAGYKLNASTSQGSVVIPQAGGILSLNGRDSKIHVTDYDVGGINLIYSSAEVYTWAECAGDEKLLVLYGGADEVHEVAFSASLEKPTVAEGSGVKIVNVNGTWVLNWKVTPQRRIVKLGSLEVHLLWRNEAYSYWPMELPSSSPIGAYSSRSKSTVVVKAGYLLRTASISGRELKLTGDVNSTTDIEVIALPTKGVSAISFNGRQLKTTKSHTGKLLAAVKFESPKITLPDFTRQTWKYLDTLPEIRPSYDDSLWTSLTHQTTNNPLNLSTPTSMYASDYGYHAGSLIYRGHFSANGKESNFVPTVNGGVGFAYSVWLNSNFLGSWVGSGSNQTASQTFTFPTPLPPGSANVITVVIDHMGQDEEAPGTDAIKFPRGILDYSLAGHQKSDVAWKMTGNLGGEQYHDLARGPRNEGAMFAERQGYHLPRPPNSKWSSYSPVKDGVLTAGIGFFTSSFNLNVPEGYDVPLSFVLNQTSKAATSKNDGQNYRCQLFVNGYQFGKYGMFCLFLFL